MPPSLHKRNIFFLETSCNSYKMGRIFITSRQACAVESAARMNPDMDVYLLFASPGLIVDYGSESDKFLHVLITEYPNVKIQHFNIERYVQNTPVEDLWTSGKIYKSSYPIVHTSDALRLLTLWKYGGIYLDLDVIVVKNLSNFPENFAGAEAYNLLANGVMGFSQFGKGREYINDCLQDFAINFDGTQWGFNGPHLITRNILKHCPLLNKSMAIRFGKCEEFKIFSPSAFYLVPYPNWQWFFNENYTEIIETSVRESSYLIHVWNKFSFDRKIPKNQVRAPYMRLAAQYCPRMIQQINVEL
ncbi:hypothetical protein ABEB36_014848 [Hypothenemus hampei]